MATIKKVNEMNDIPFDPKNIWKMLRDITKDRQRVRDGVYDISDIDYCDPNQRYNREVNDKGRVVYVKATEEQLLERYNDMINFIKKYPDFVVAEAYQTEYPLFLAEMPTKQIDYVGSGFNHGSNNIIDNCPKRVLICGEDD